MRVDLLKINTEQFNLKEGYIAGDKCFLVTPKNISLKFTQSTKIFRSSIWREDGELINAGLPKFYDWSINQEEFPLPTNISNCKFLSKVDGSLLCVGMYKGELILRTRNVFTAELMPNSSELQIFKSEILPKLQQNINYFFGDEKTWGITYLFEWTSPNNIIVIKDDDKPKFYLIGAINLSNYHLWPQDELDKFAQELELLRPKSYNFNSFNQLIDDVTKWEGLEGVVVYSNSGQSLHRLKSDWYKTRHRFIDIASLEHTIDLFLEQNCPNYCTFKDNIIKNFDIFVWEKVKSFVSQICDGYKEVLRILDSFENCVKIHEGKTRKEFALAVLSAYGKTNRASFVFQMKDKGCLDNDAKKKLLFQVLKK